MVTEIVVAAVGGAELSDGAALSASSGKESLTRCADLRRWERAGAAS